MKQRSTEVALTDSDVQRRGRTSQRWDAEPSDISVNALTSHKKLQVLFDIASGGRGGGRTVLSLRLGTKDFDALLDAMVKVDRQAAMAAMASEMQRQIAQQPTFDAELRKEGRIEMRRRAKEEYEAERLEINAFSKIRELVREMDGAQ